MYLLLHHLATNRFARLGAVLALGLVLAIVVAFSSQQTAPRPRPRLYPPASANRTRQPLRIA
jgi:hypothetical protein